MKWKKMSEMKNDEWDKKEWMKWKKTNWDEKNETWKKTKKFNT
jgi:hypothetical protein